MAVWIDHKEARIFHVPVEIDEATAMEEPKHIHPKHPKHAEKAHPEEAKHYYHAVAKLLEGHAEILVVGPSTAKLELMRHLHKHDPAVEARVVGIETVDHPTDGQLIAYAKKYFIRVDRMI